MATIEVVLIAVLGSMTVLPAAMAMQGDRVEKARIPFIGRRRQAAAANRAPEADNALRRNVLAKPGLFAVLGVIVLLALASPALGMKTEKLGTDKLLPANNPMVSVVKAIGNEFPGAPAPAGIVIKNADITAPQVTRSTTTTSSTRASCRSSPSSWG